jgi:cardiolipin synthase A/B
MKLPSSRIFKGGHAVELLRSGREYFSACIREIDKAVHYIHFQTYIVDDDETGRRFVNALIRAANRGVRVYFLLDAYGGSSFSKHLTDKVLDAGIFFRMFSPAMITKGYKLSLRLHHKVLLIDGETAIIGGMNIANRYRGTKELKEWLDFAILIKGPECAHVLFILKKLWNKAFIRKFEKARETVHSPAVYPDDIYIKVLQNNWYRNKIEILKSYRSAIRHSKDRMIILASYFLPGRNERRLLSQASMRGVDIKIVLASESDAYFFKRATNFLYDFILRNNIMIYEYLPSNLHAKVAVVDGEWSTIGSYNLNHLSDYGSVEMNVNILSAPFASEFEKQLRRIIEKDCRLIRFSEYTKRKSWLSRLADWASYQLIRFFMRVMFLMTAREK